MRYKRFTTVFPTIRLKPNNVFLNHSRFEREGFLDCGESGNFWFHGYFRCKASWSYDE